jgi:4-hydroxy-4-methyl-2-oxoglutarate aldolase
LGPAAKASRTVSNHASYDLESLIPQLERLYSAVLSDALDHVGVRDRVLRSTLRPATADSVVFGRAAPALCAETGRTEGAMDSLIAFCDSLRSGDVAVVSVFEDGESAVWGELLSTAAVARGARGAIVDGLTRDVRAIRQMRFPLFVRGMSPVDSISRTEFIMHGQPVRCGGIWVAPGDLIFGDEDGIVAVPAEAVTKVVQYAYTKSVTENTVRDELRKGRLLRDVYDEYHVL